MSRGRRYLWTAALIAGLLTGTLQAAERETKPAPEKSGNWFTRLFTKSEKKDDKKAAKDKEPPKPPLVNSTAAMRSRELSNYLRRLAVCDQLAQVAYDTKDDDLQRQVDQLKERVWTTYQVRTDQLGAGAGRYESDDKILDKHLGNRTAAKDSTDETLLGKNPSKNTLGRTALKENRR